MNTHRIEADKVVVEDDRRVEWKDERPSNWIPGKGRTIDHNCNKKHKIIYIPVGERPTKGEQFYIAIGGTGLGIVSPFHPDDTLILMDDWGDWIFNKSSGVHQVLWKSLSAFDKSAYNWKPVSTMPLELDSQCQQYKVVKVLGVEQLPDHVFEEKKDWPWHFKLLTEAK